MKSPLAESSLISHLEALRNTLLSCLIAVAVLFPVAYWATPYCIGFLVRHSCPPELGALSYFSPMEVFIAQLKMALILALALAYPWCATQVWRFLLPALYVRERRALAWWIGVSTLLFATGAFFCFWWILPLVMKFSAGFATAELRPVVGLANFLNLAGWLTLAFALMFQAPLVVVLAVRFGVVSVATLRKFRPYVIVGILILAALLTPPDVISQVLLALPTWLLFEIGLLIASRHKSDEAPEEENSCPEDEDGMADFYNDESNR